MTRALPTHSALSPSRRAKCLALAALPSLLLLTPAAHATSYTWTNNGNDSQWSNSLNWSPNGVPTANDTALINISSGSIASSNTVFYNYTGANVTLSQLTITHAASKFGSVSVLSLGANVLSVNNENIGDSTNGGPLAGEIDQSGLSTNTITNTLTLGRNSSDTGYYTLSGNATLQAASENFGVSGHAVFTQTGGTHYVYGAGNSGFFMAVNPSAIANYTLQDGAISCSASTYIGYGGNATLTQTGGSLGVSNSSGHSPSLYLGYFAGSNGNYSMTGQSSGLGVDSTIYIGYGGNGTFSQDSGSIGYNWLSPMSPSITLAHASTATGTCTLSGAGLMNINALTVGQAGNATFNHISGLIYATNVLLAQANGSHASYLLNDGLLSDSGSLTVGDSGNGTFTQNGGSVTLGPYGTLAIGQSANGVGIYNLSGGTLSIGQYFSIGTSGTGTFNQSGGSVYASYVFPLDIGGTSSYFLSGGTLTVNGIQDGGFFSRIGGTLTPTSMVVYGSALFRNVNTKLTGFGTVGTTNNWTGKADITNTKLVIQPTAANRASQLATLQNQALYGRTHNAGIIDSLLPPNMAVAVIDNSALPTPLTTFGGIPVDSNSILLSQELLGDANMDGQIDLTDLSTVLNNFGAHHPRLDRRQFRRPAHDRPYRPLRRPQQFRRAINLNASISQLPISQSPATPAPEPAALALLIPLAPLMATPPPPPPIPRHPPLTATPQTI